MSNELRTTLLLTKPVTKVI